MLPLEWPSGRTLTAMHARRMTNNRRDWALSEVNELLRRHVSEESAEVITAHARRSLTTARTEPSDFTEDLLARVSQASAIFLAPNVRLHLLGELRATLEDGAAPGSEG